jgi:methyltransferase (TIGR00027 family)
VPLQKYILLVNAFPYRDPTPELPLHIWEVDHPATQEWKRRRLAEARIPVPATVRFVPVDFERDDLAAALTHAGFDFHAGALFAWLGVVPYLTPAAIRTTLVLIARATVQGGGVVFDYALARENLSDLQRQAYDAFAERVRAIGEPLQSGFDPETLVAELLALGFPAAHDLTPEVLTARYLAGRTDDLRIGTLGHLMWAGTALHGE